jgi:hypothetical protein
MLVLETSATMPKRKSAAAVGPYLGFGLQTVRLCYRALTEPDDAWVFVEHEDDISVQYADGTRLLEQVKSGPKSNPIENWSKDLWKCFANWMDACEAEDWSKPNTRFELYLSPVHAGAFAEAMSNATDDGEIERVLASIEEDGKKIVKSDAKVHEFAKRFLLASIEQKKGLVRGFQLTREEDPLTALRDLYALAVSPALLDQVCTYAIGQAKQQTDTLMRAGQPGKLRAGDFKAMVRLFLQRLNSPALLVFVDAPSMAVVNSTFAGRPHFVRQLELIEASQPQRLSAVSDFLRASAAKTDWAAKGVLLPHALDTWDNDLVARHQAIADSLNALHSHLPPQKLGAALYAECRKAHLLLDAKSVPDHFVHGCFNDLADRKRVGWHPEHDKILGAGDLTNAA